MPQRTACMVAFLFLNLIISCGLWSVAYSIVCGCWLCLRNSLGRFSWNSIKVFIDQRMSHSNLQWAMQFFLLIRALHVIFVFCAVLNRVLILDYDRFIQCDSKWWNRWWTMDFLRNKPLNAWKIPKNCAHHKVPVNSRSQLNMSIGTFSCHACHMEEWMQRTV